MPINFLGFDVFLDSGVFNLFTNESNDRKFVYHLSDPKAAITRCDLSPRFFCIDATLLCEFESDKI